MSRPGARTETMQQKVYQELRHSLMVGAFVPGESISLRKLAETLQTSLMPVREAVSRLIAERAFESLPNRNVIVPYLSEDNIGVFQDSCHLFLISCGLFALLLRPVRI